MEVSSTSMPQLLVAGSSPVHRSQRIAVPPIGAYDVGHVARIASVAPHPGSERLVIGEQRRVVPAASQSRRLRVRAHVEQADRDGAQRDGRRRGEYLAGRHRVTGQQQVAAIGLKLQRASNDGLCPPLAPRDIRMGRHVDDVVELDTLDRGGQGRGDELTHR